MKRFLFIAFMIIGCFIVNAQDSEFEKDVAKLLEVNGSAANYDLAFDQLVVQYKMMKPNVPQEFWEAARRDVFSAEIAELNKKMIPLYQKNFSHEEVKKLIEFYQSPLGKKLTEGTTKIGKESIQIAQTWGMELGGKLNTYLLQKGF